MKKGLPYIIVGLISTLMLSGCTMLNFGFLHRKSVQVRKTPRSGIYILNGDTTRNGYSSRSNYWIAYSDRDPNATRTSVENEMPLKSLSFMDAVCVTKKKNNYVKIAKYSPDVDLTETKGSIPRKATKNYGWIKKEKLMLWPAALSNNDNGFAIKAVTHLGGNAVLTHPQQFIVNDSLLLFSTPSLQTPSGKKIAARSIVYLYKQSEDGKSVLVGSEPLVTPDKAQQIMLGWLSKDAIAVWSTRTAFNLNAEAPDYAGLYLRNDTQQTTDSIQPILTGANLRSRSFFENIFPVHNRYCYSNNVMHCGYFDNIMNYTRNSVYNVVGGTINYQKYQKIITDANHINIVFVFDVSDNNGNYFPLIKSVMQDLQVYFDTTTRLKNCRFGAVTYRRNNCSSDTLPNTLALSSNFQDVEKYIDTKFATNSCSDASSYQPLFRGINQACGLLQPVKDETNIITIIGTTGNDDLSGKYTLAQAIGKLTEVKARMLVFQSINKSSNAYNDFILDAEKMVTNSATNIAVYKKDKLVDINDVISKPAYSMRHGDSGIYSLDYPARNMTQGIVMFPQKGTVMRASAFRQYFDTLMSQVMNDNQNINTKLTEYFRTIGIKNTTLRPEFAAYAGKTTINPEVARSFAGVGNSFFIPAFAVASPGSLEPQHVSFGVFLNEPEYDKQMELFYGVYSRTAARDKFRKRAACRHYKAFVRHYINTHRIVTDDKLKQMTLAKMLYTWTGFISSDSLYNTVTLQQLKMQQTSTVLSVFNGFKYAADAFQEKKNTRFIKTNNNGRPYYWITGAMMPGTVPAPKTDND